MTIPTQKKLLYAASILVLGLAACMAASSTAAFEGVHEPVSAGTVSSSRLSSGRPTSADHYSSCWKTGDPDSPAAGVGTTQSVKGHYRLYSTFFVRSPNKVTGYAAIAHNKQERVYAEKEIVGEYVLAQVFSDRVILKKGGAVFTLERAPSAARAAPTSSRSARRSKVPGRKALKRRPREDLPGPVRPGADAGGVTATQRFTVSKRDKDYIAENFEKLLHDVNLQTELAGKDDSMTGIRINNIKPGSILYRVGGLRPGDIIRKVNGTPVNSMRQAFSIHESLTKRNVKKVDVEIERNGKIFNRIYSITNSGAR